MYICEVKQRAMASFIENTVSAYDKNGNRYTKAKYVEFVVVRREKGKKYPRRTTIWRQNINELHKANWFDRTLMWFAARTNNSKVVNINQEFVKEVREWGVPQAVYNLLEELGIIAHLRKLEAKSRRKYSLIDFVVGYVTVSLLGEFSKLKYYEKGQKLLYGQDTQKLHQIYRAVSAIGKEFDWKSLEELREKSRKQLFKEEVEILLFDFTTVYWQSELSDALRNFGYSKDNQWDKVQVLVSMVVDRNGFPIHIEFWEGNSSEKKAIKEFVSNLSRDLSLKQVVFVGDAGMYSKGLLSELRSMGWQVLIRLPKSSLTKTDKENILSKEGWTELEKDKETGEKIKEVKELKGSDGYRIIAIRDHSLRRRQESQLEEYLGRFIDVEALKKAVKEGKKIDIKSLKVSAKKIVGSKTLGLLKVKEEEVEFDTGRYEELLKWSGISLLLTDTDWSAKDLIKRYGLLQKIERRWRDLKSGLSVRPVYHWSEERVKGHFILKFIALQVVSLLEKKLEEAGILMSWERAVGRLHEVKAVYLRFADGTSGWVRTEVADKTTLEIMKVLGVPTQKIVITLEKENTNNRKKGKKKTKNEKTKT